LIYVGKYIASNRRTAAFVYWLKVLNSSPASSMDFEALKGLLRRVAEEVKAEIRQVEKELAEARRVGARVEELSAKGYPVRGQVV
jgi:cellobiose-specific phosphotransferase system component IIA